MSELQTSGIFQPGVIEDIQAKAESGLYAIRGFGTLRERRWATFDDLTFLPCSLTRIPLEGYREKCSTKTVLGTRFAKKPIELDIPVMITGMSWGALSYNAKVALAKGAAAAGSSNTTGDGGMLQAERENSRTLIYEVLPSRYGINIHHMRHGRRHRVDDRARRQTGHRRTAAGLESFRPHRRAARSAHRRRPAQRRPGIPIFSGRTT